MAVHQLAQSQLMGPSDRQDQPSIVQQAVVIESEWMRSRSSSGSIRWVLLVFKVVFVVKNHYPRSREHFLTTSQHRRIHPFGGLGFRDCETILSTCVKVREMVSNPGSLFRAVSDGPETSFRLGTVYIQI